MNNYTHFAQKCGQLYTNLKSLTFFYRTILFVHIYTQFLPKNCGQLYTNLKSLTFFYRTILFVHNYTHFAQSCGQLYTNLKSLTFFYKTIPFQKKKSICVQLYTLCPKVWTIVHKFKITNFLLQNNPISEKNQFVHNYTHFAQKCGQLYTNLKSLTFFYKTIYVCTIIHNCT